MVKYTYKKKEKPKPVPAPRKPKVKPTPKPRPKKTMTEKSKPVGTHKMPDGTVMTGKTHSKDSKPVKKKAPAPKPPAGFKSGDTVKIKRKLKGKALKTLEGDEKEKGTLKKFVSSVAKLKGGNQAIKMASSTEDKPFATDEGSDYLNGLTKLFSAFQRGEKLTQESFNETIQSVIKIGDRTRGNMKFFQKHKDDLVSSGRSIPSRSEIERKTDSKEEFNYVIGKLRGMHGNLRSLGYKK